jgi:hypothetical protein
MRILDLFIPHSEIRQWANPPVPMNRDLRRGVIQNNELCVLCDLCVEKDVSS